MSELYFDEHTGTCPRCHDLVRIQVPRQVSGETAGDALERQAKDQRIRDLERREADRDQEVVLWHRKAVELEREVERLKGETVRQGDLIRALIDADRAKEGGAATCAENAQVRSGAAMAKDPQL